MYVRTLRVKRLKRLRDLELSFVHDDAPRKWTVLIGENGTAKTSILQAIALAAAGSKQVNTLGTPVVKHLRDRRSDDDEMSIEATFDFSQRSKDQPELHPLAPANRRDFQLVSRVSLAADSTTLDGEAHYHPRSKEPRDPLDLAREKHTRLWFVAGYGVSRFLPEATSAPSLDRPSIERMDPLFRAQATLQSTSFSNHFLAKDERAGLKRGTTSRRFATTLNQAIKLGGEELLPDIQKFELRGQGGARDAKGLIESDRFQQRMGSGSFKVAGVALSHGYQSTFAWIADLIGHVLLEADTAVATTEMDGLVLLDEIDLYLHPTWQASFVAALRRIFPKMQFIATTHSPVVLSSLAPHEVVRLAANPETGDVERVELDSATGTWVPVRAVDPRHPDPRQPDPRPMTGGELYRHWFGLERLTPNPRGEDLRRYLVLAGDPTRSASEVQELEQLKEQLKDARIEELPAPVPLNRSARKASHDPD